MSKWKLCRQFFGTEEFIFEEGDEVTIGRGLNNTITLSSLVISRNHCLLSIKENQLLVTDLKSSNGVFVGTKKITPNIPYVVKESDIIGIGWASGVPLGKVQDEEKFVFEVVKVTPSRRFTFQFDNEIDDIEEQVACLTDSHTQRKLSSPILEVKPTLKRKISTDLQDNKVDAKIPIKDVRSDVISVILSDSDNDINSKKQENLIKKPKLEPKLEPICEDKPIDKNYLNIKSENEFLEFEAFNVKQEHFGYDDEPIQIDSDSDSESEHWYLRLSQSSPGKPFTKVPREKKIDIKPEENSYSQMDDDLIPNSFIDNEEDYMDDLITIPPQPPSDSKNDEVLKEESLPKNEQHSDEAENKKLVLESPIIKEVSNKTGPNLMSVNLSLDVIDGCSSKIYNKDNKNSSNSLNLETETHSPKKAQMIAPLTQITKKKPSKDSPLERNYSKTTKHKKSKHSSKKHISNSQKEERKKKLKEIAFKEKEGTDQKSNLNQNDVNAAKSVTNVKITSSNRGAFLTDTVQIVKPMKRKENVLHSKSDKDKINVGKESNDMKPLEPTKMELSKLEKELNPEYDNINDKKKNSEKNENHVKHKHDNSKSKSKKSKSNKLINKSTPEIRVPLKSLKPLTDSEDSFAGKPFSKVEPLPPNKTKKSVRFSEAQPEIHYFEIEEGNRMKKTSLVKTTLVDVRQMPIFSLEKITLMKILRWNPHWLEEQIIHKDPPPILGHNNPPLAIFHSFVNHNQYVQLIGDLLLMEIWECLSLAHKKIRNQACGLQMRIASLPPAPAQDNYNFDLYTLSVDVSMPTSDLRNLPRVGEVLLVLFGPENAKMQRFFFVHNVRCLPSPPSNRNSFYNISLQATFTEKMRILKPGDVMIGLNLASINNELSLFEALAYLARSPLSEAILKPEPRHFMRNDNMNISMESQWTTTLNNSQQMAVKYSVSAALGDQPCIQMVQGPPGTGKSSVICAIVMTYFYDPSGKKEHNRGKILICATSNAAVDELVIRLLHIRQSLPKNERFRMVRVGRAEAMHPRARDVSSLQLAQRDASRLLQEPNAQGGLAQEISHLEAKINMWKSAAQEASEKDPMRVAYCQGRVSELVKRIVLLRGTNGGGGVDGPRPEQLLAAERRIIEGADIIVTTLASAHNHKMRGLKRRIALCIVDEAGQAIEPETLIPLTLDVTKITLIGDPQQLPGYICSPRAKKHGLGDSLFSRLSSCSEAWAGERGGAGAGVVLLDVQYRMQPQIADYPNRAFYGGRVRSAAPPRPAPPPPLPPYAIVGVSSGDRGQNASGANDIEAWGVSRIATALAEQLRPRGLSLAVITPYNAHKDLIKKYLRILSDSAETQVEVNTVDSFQGQERDVVVVSLARSCGVGFLTDAGRMNVMLTRARHALLVCLNPLAVLKNHLWRTLLEDAQKRKLYTTLPYKMCQANSAVSNEEVLKQIAI